ncbi:MAG: hypothetical protein KGL55_14980, partial [Rhodospirillales bacterium]|nr:hypothetical protein [Rhodospirillales bacterium]
REPARAAGALELAAGRLPAAEAALLRAAARRLRGNLGFFRRAARAGGRRGRFRPFARPPA